LERGIITLISQTKGYEASQRPLQLQTFNWIQPMTSIWCFNVVSQVATVKTFLHKRTVGIMNMLQFTSPKPSGIAW